jgi:hypothetical protein
MTSKKENKQKCHVLSEEELNKTGATLQFHPCKSLTHCIDHQGIKFQGYSPEN